MAESARVQEVAARVRDHHLPGERVYGGVSEEANGAADAI